MKETRFTEEALCTPLMVLPAREQGKVVSAREVYRRSRSEVPFTDLGIPTW